MYVFPWKVTIVDFGRFLHLDVARNPQHFFTFTPLHNSSWSQQFLLGIMKTLKRSERSRRQSRIKQVHMLCTEWSGLLSKGCLSLDLWITWNGGGFNEFLLAECLKLLFSNWLPWLAKAEGKMKERTTIVLRGQPTFIFIYFMNTVLSQALKDIPIIYISN